MKKILMEILQGKYGRELQNKLMDEVEGNMPFPEFEDYREMGRERKIKYIRDNYIERVEM